MNNFEVGKGGECWLDVVDLLLGIDVSRISCLLEGVSQQFCNWLSGCFYSICKLYFFKYGHENQCTFSFSAAVFKKRISIVFQ